MVELVDMVTQVQVMVIFLAVVLEILEVMLEKMGQIIMRLTKEKMELVVF